MFKSESNSKTEYSRPLRLAELGGQYSTLPDKLSRVTGGVVLVVLGQRPAGGRVSGHGGDKTFCSGRSRAGPSSPE